ncbi:SpoIIE family protein phosphatase [candidate division KSB1 bacterium]|nr:SpoIIE family protein phosphatase [candidate division KSB1 bacterium]
MKITNASVFADYLSCAKYDSTLAYQRGKLQSPADKITFVVVMMVAAICIPSMAQVGITIDAQKDAFYEQLTGPDDGHVFIPHSDFLPLSGPRPDGDADLSANVWVAWDQKYFYLYAEVKDDVVKVNNRFHPENDCIELKFDPDPKKKALAGIVNARLSALDSTEARNPSGVDNLYSEGNLAPEAVSPENYARRLTDDGYVLEMRLAWNWLKTKGRVVNVGVGEIFGLAINFHDNDSDNRDGSIQWSPTLADEVWNTPQLLGTMEFLADHKLRFIRRNAIDPGASMGKTYLSKDRLAERPGRPFRLENWKYQPGDNPEWANPGFDDSSWDATCPCILADHKPEGGWDGIGWFRVDVSVDSSLWGVPLAFDLRQTGASEIYLDGKLLYSFGKVGRSKEDEVALIDINPKYIVFNNQQDHVLAIRYSNFSTDYHNQLGIDAGFNCFVSQDLNSHFRERAEGIRTKTIYQILFVAIPVVLAFLHFFLFLFYPRTKENLYFAICMFCWAIIVFEDFHTPFTTNIRQLILFESISLSAITPAIVFGLLTAYASVYEKLPKQYLFFIVTGVILTTWGLLSMWGQFPSTLKAAGLSLYLYIALAAIEIFRVYFIRGFKKKKAHWITGIGFVAFMLAILYQILIALQVFRPLGGFGIVYVYGILILSVTVSIDISRNFARTNRDLEDQLIQVKQLSRKAIEQERHAKEEEIARKMLEADNARKTQELEEARKLQLSMLPKEIPRLANLEISAFMLPAYEVGGDYYDFHVADDGALTVAVGDATGHGMKAGTMVASVKSLFTAFGDNTEIVFLLKKWSEIIRHMHLYNIYMAMTLVRLKGQRLVASAAGMPPLLLYRKRTQTVEEMVIKGMPLGAPAPYQYEKRETMLASGDTVLLMSDGFPELFNDQNEMFDYPQVKELYRKTAERPANQIIEILMAAGEKWKNGRSQLDDITLVVLKVK